MYAHRSTTNPKTGRVEHVFVDLDAVYPNPDDLREEFCFEELRARHRGWLDRQWSPAKPKPTAFLPTDDSSTTQLDSQSDMTLDVTTADMTADLTLGGSKKPRKERAGQPRRRKVIEVRGATQTSKPCRHTSLRAAADDASQSRQTWTRRRIAKCGARRRRSRR